MKKPAKRLEVRVRGSKVAIRYGFCSGRIYMVSLSTTEKFTITLTPNPAGSVIDGPPTYPTDVANVVIVVPSPDGLTGIVMGHTAGTCTITPTALAGGKTITGAPIQVTVTAAPPPPVFATSLDENLSPVEAQ